jgi:class 3 adenylate cyclase
VEQDVTVLMLDVSGYSKLSEQLPTEQLNALVERYFSAFLDLIREADGDINETAGDGFMAIFLESSGTDHPQAAVRTALSQLQTTQRLNAEQPDTPLSVHMGVNSGVALVGSTRFEGARGTRWTFTASGPVTILAARLVGIADGGQVVIGPETYRRVADDFRIESLGEHSLKNLSEPIEVHLVLG